MSKIKVKLNITYDTIDAIGRHPEFHADLPAHLDVGGSSGADSKTFIGIVGKILPHIFVTHFFVRVGINSGETGH